MELYSRIFGVEWRRQGQGAVAKRFAQVVIGNKKTLTLKIEKNGI
jgi:hypothetical protein